MTANTRTFPLPCFDPLALYRQFCPNGPGFLETLNPLPKTGRYSVLPLRWQEHYNYSDGQMHIDDGVTITSKRCDPFDALAEILEQRKVQPNAATPFIGGFFGYLGYDLSGSIEDLPHRAERDLNVPDLELYWVDTTAVYDHQNSTLTLASLDPDLELQPFEAAILAGEIHNNEASYQITTPLKPILSKEQFMQRVERGRNYIAAGDIYQVNLSCRFDGAMTGSSEALYQRLREINPSPFACLLRFPNLDIISSSPERLVSLRDGIAEVRPIAGTRPRGYDRHQDQQLGDELLCHPKERAEHIMLIDLERNDLGKVCKAGTVKVDELMVLERYSHVTHIVSNVRGELNDDCSPFELLRATFPGGTITGVPKKRCMEIIDELEPVGRGSYTGSAGYISACGTIDFNILIRSFQRVADKLTYQAGAGIVADSIAAKEWQECLHKGEALRKTLENKDS